MKTFLSLIILGALIVSGLGQTRNVLVGTNSAVVQPTNFWSADASNARSGLGLGTAATNPSSAFQPASSTLSNLVSGGALTLTNITVGIGNVTGLQSALDGKLGTNPTLAIANISNLQTTLDGKLGTNPTLAIANISGLQTNLDSKLSLTGSAAGLTNFPTVPLASNITGTAPLATNVTGIVALVNGGTGATNASSARSALGGTTVGENLFTLSNPDDVRFLRLNANNSVSALTAADFRTALSVGTNLGTVTSVGLTVPAIFSLSTPTITSSGTFALTLANQTSRHAFLAPNGGGIPTFRAVESDDLPSLAISKITGLQTALDGKLATSGTASLATNVTGIVALVNGGTGSTNATDARTALGLGTAATNAATAFQPSSTVLSNLANNNGASLTNLTITNVGTVALASNVTGIVALVNGGTGATNASGARTALELGTAATNPATAFQPSSSVLTNLAANNGGSLTNVTAANVVGTVGLASNITGTAPLATNVTGVVALANGGTAGTNAASARTSLGATTVGANLFTLVNPDDTRFIRLNANNTVSALSAADMRTALSVGTNAGTVTSVGMTVPNIFSLSTPTITSSGTFGLTLANQSSRQAFLVPNGGGIPAFRALESDDLPSLAINKITGLQTALDGKLATSGTATLATNVTGVVAVANGGTGGTSAEAGRTGLGATTVGSAVFTLANPSAIRFLRYNVDNTVSALSDSDFRTAIGLGTAATNPATAFQPSSTVLSNLASSNGASLTNIPLAGVIGALATNGNGAGLTNLTAANITGTVALASNVTGTIAISNGGSGATTAGGARTNLGLGATNNVVFNSVTTELLNYGTNLLISLPNQELYDGGITVLSWSTNSIEINAPILLGTSNAISATRTNLGLGWPALTNTTASGFQTALFGTNTNPVLVNTNGEVVSPTNFWQVSPANTRVQVSQPVVNATNNATNARNLYLYSLAISTTGVTNTVQLPTNSATLLGDVATVIHEGPTSSVTAVRQTGAGSNLITLNQFQEAVKFIYESAGWRLADNISYVEPIYFSGTNAASNAAASRTNLGLGTTNNVQFKQVSASDGETTVLNSSGIESTEWAARVSLEERLLEEGGLPAFVWSTNGNTTWYPFVFTNNSAATTRTNLGLPLAALTNSNTTNFQAAVFQTNTAPVSAAQFGDRAAWMEVNVITNGSNVSFRIPLYK